MSSLRYRLTAEASVPYTGTPDKQRQSQFEGLIRTNLSGERRRTTAPQPGPSAPANPVGIDMVQFKEVAVSRGDVPLVLPVVSLTYALVPGDPIWGEHLAVVTALDALLQPYNVILTRGLISIVGNHVLLGAALGTVAGHLVADSIQTGDADASDHGLLTLLAGFAGGLVGQFVERDLGVAAVFAKDGDVWRLQDAHVAMAPTQPRAERLSRA